MVTDSNERHEGSPRWGYLLLAALIFVLVGAILAGLWQLPRLVPQFAGPTATATHTSLPPSVTPVTPTETPTSPPPTITPTPTMAHPTITGLTAEVDDQARTVTFRMAAGVPPDRRIDEVLFWYDTETGHEVQYIAGPLPPSIALSHELDAAQEGLTTTQILGELDYWWLVRDTSGESVRAGGTASLGPSLQALIATPAPTPPPIDFTWTMSGSQHYQFHVAPGTAAERDLPRIGPFAEAALARTTAILEIEFDDKMDVYLVPRLFWQGGASYSGKVQLISYLDRNYTSVETWSYFTHEGTHALAQDLFQPKEHEGRPDGVLVEGLAVWASGGHYRQEPLDAWAAVVAASDEYIPLADLRNGSFYEFQHEISYLEAASFVNFLVERYGLDKLKELYGLATGDADNDEALVERLYGQDYAGLEAAWLDYLAGLEPTPEQAETWRLTLRSFDLMRRYETDLDSDARVLPSNPPTEWTTDTLKIFLHRLEAPVNVVLETALIAAQDRLYRGDLAGAATLLDDVEATLDADPVGDRLDQPSLLARRDILELVAAQDRAVLRADLGAYLDTIDPASALDVAVERALQLPLTAYGQEVVRLDVASDGLSAQGVVLVHGQVAGGVLADDGQLFAVAFVRTGEQWRMSAKERYSAAGRWEIGGKARSPGGASPGD
jgi:hypothetical protein